jgi:hypothetical protein
MAWELANPPPPFTDQPDPAEGPGRKPKAQRYWPPKGAPRAVQVKYAQLQKASAAVDAFLEKLRKAQAGKEVQHLMRILLRNIRKRDELLAEALRLAAGKTAADIEVADAEKKLATSLGVFHAQLTRLWARRARLARDYPADEASPDVKHGIDMGKLGKKEREGLRTMENWATKKCDLVYESWDNLELAYLKLEGDAAVPVEQLQDRIHAAGGHSEWTTQLWQGGRPTPGVLGEDFANPEAYTSTFREGELEGLMGVEVGELDALMDYN